MYSVKKSKRIRVSALCLAASLGYGAIVNHAIAQTGTAVPSQNPNLAATTAPEAILAPDTQQNVAPPATPSVPTAPQPVTALSSTTPEIPVAPTVTTSSLPVPAAPAPSASTLAAPDTAAATEKSTPVAMHNLHSKPPYATEHDQAIFAARNGNYKKSLETLSRLHDKYPHDLTLGQDYAAVSSWAGLDSQATEVYAGLPHNKEPKYLIQALGLSYRNLHEPDKALEVYRRGLKTSPNDVSLKAGEINSLTDMGAYKEAIMRSNLDLARNGERLSVLLAAANATDTAAEKDPDQFNQIYESLRFYQRAQRIAPNDPDVMRGITHVTDIMGAPQFAREMADKHRKLMSNAEYRRIHGDEAAALVRWGVLEPENDASRYVETDKAIEHLDRLINTWSSEGLAAQADVTRARLDRLVAYRDRSRMQDCVTDYEKLKAEGVTVPNYALSAVGDAYLYLRQPETARDIYLHVLETEPKNFEVRRQLFYAYVEIDDFDDAYKTIDQLDADQSVWIRLKGLPTPLPNTYRETADVDAASARLFAGELSAADDMMTPITHSAAAEVRNHKVLGDIYYARGWPRAAMEQYEIGKALQEEHKDVGNETGIALANLDMQNFKVAEAQISDLMRRYPENLDVQNAARQWQVHNMAELDVNGVYNIRPSNSKAGGTGYGADVTVYSTPIDYNWRLFAGQGYEHETEPNDEGKISVLRSKAGVEYRDGPITVEAAPTFNAFHATDHVGGFADGTYQFNDQWSARADAQLLSDSTPLRALNKNIRSDEYGVGATWRQSESREVTGNVAVQPFTDGNFREEGTLGYMQRFYTLPHWQFDGLVNTAVSHNSADETRPYYNPRTDAGAQLGPRVTEILYRRYDTSYQHSLTFTPGVYWEEQFSGSFAYTLRYEQLINFNDTLQAGWSAGVSRQAFDGVYENDASITVNLVKRF